MGDLTRRERIKLLLQGKEIDRIPVSFWRHFYHLENNAADLAEIMLAFQKKFDWDFIKINPRASYHIEPFGAEIRFSQKEFEKPQIIQLPLKKVAEREKLEVISNAVFNEQLESIQLIKRNAKDEIYIVETIFSPLSVLGDLVPQEQLIKEMMENPAIVHSALEFITEVFSNFAVDCLNAGADGIFFATTEWATLELLTKEEYLEFGKPYDLKFLDKIKEAECNILHVCKENNMLDLFWDYPVKVVNWNATSNSNLSLKEGAKLLNKVVMGGIDHINKLLNLTQEQIQAEINKIIEENKGLNYILAPGCTILPETPEENLKAIREIIK
jgi:uroporphyrinogen decarboxylase